jgi:hypothetical protein
MRNTIVAALVLAGCATGSPSGDSSDRNPTRISTAYLEARGGSTDDVIRVQAGSVNVRHVVPPSGRLRATMLEGLDPANRQVKYEWTNAGTYEMEVSGRYRHTVGGSIVGGGSQRIRSTLTYTLLTDSLP